MNGVRIVSNDEWKKEQERYVRRQWFTKLSFGNVLSLTISVVALVLAVVR